MTPGCPNNLLSQLRTALAVLAVGLLANFWCGAATVDGAQWNFGRRATAPAPHPSHFPQRTAARNDLRSLEERDNPTARKIGTYLKAFGIPFSVSDPDERYIEVQLYMSRDRGQSWNFHSRQPATASEFPFESRGDGEYWFAIRTLDRDRQLHPAGAMLPELKIIVDTVRPELDFRIQTDPAGRIVCRWMAEDDHLVPTTTRIAFRPLISTDDQNNQWLSVPYKPVANLVDRTFADQYAWWPEPRSREVLVQIAISDIAGNEAVEERQIVLPPISTAPGQLAIAQPGSGGSPSPAAAAAGSSASRMYEVSSTTQSPGPDRQPADPSGTTRAARPMIGDGNAAASPQTAPAQTPLAQPLMYGTTNAPSTPPLPTPEDPSAPAVIPWTTQSGGGSGQKSVLKTERPVFPDERTGLGISGSSVVQPDPTSGPAQQPDGPPEANRTGAQQPDPSGFGPAAPGTDGSAATGPVLPRPDATMPQPDLATAGSGMGSAGVPAVPSQAASLSRLAGGSATRPDENGPSSERSLIDRIPGTSPSIRYLNTRRFRLDYSLDSIDPQRLAKVVLWMTPDDGQTWTAWAEDTDNQSPVPVEMAEPGLYGFRIVFHTIEGLAGRAPVRGDQADVWIAIDLEHPDARLTGAPYGTGSNAGKLLIQWIAGDAMLRDRPVRLSYATERTGPWTIIEDGLDNRGEYAWKPDSQTPERVYLRLDVTDAAGNISSSATDQAIDLTGLIPRGRITDVEPVR